jgi:hypothetical protein
MLKIMPIDFEQAAKYVDNNHRHHRRPVGHKFSIACFDNERLCGVSMVGRPVSRYFDDKLTLEVNKLCTDGTKNACSMLYASSWRAAKALGYKRIVTYTLETESGASLRAAGWHCDGIAGGKNWSGERFRQTELNDCMKVRWSKEIVKEADHNGAAYEVGE